VRKVPADPNTLLGLLEPAPSHGYELKREYDARFGQHRPLAFGQLLVAGCSLAIAVSAGLIERKRPFALLRLSGVPVSSLNRVVLAEAAAPLLLVAAASAGLGLGVAALILKVVSVSGWRPPAAGYWYALAAGISFALLTVAATLPLLKRVTSLETARFE